MGRLHASLRGECVVSETLLWLLAHALTPSGSCMHPGMHAAVEACGRFIAQRSPETLLSPGTVDRVAEVMQGAFDRVLTPASVDAGGAVGVSVLRRLRLEAVAGIRVRNGCLGAWVRGDVELVVDVGYLGRSLVPRGGLWPLCFPGCCCQPCFILRASYSSGVCREGHCAVLGGESCSAAVLTLYLQPPPRPPPPQPPLFTLPEAVDAPCVCVRGGSQSTPVLIEAPFACDIPEANVVLNGVIDRVDSVRAAAQLGSPRLVLREFKSGLQWRETVRTRHTTHARARYLWCLHPVIACLQRMLRVG